MSLVEICRLAARYLCPPRQRHTFPPSQSIWQPPSPQTALTIVENSGKSNARERRAQKRLAKYGGAAPRSISVPAEPRGPICLPSDILGALAGHLELDFALSRFATSLNKVPVC